MIGLREEYEKMYQLEGQLWWYRNLHERVLNGLDRHFSNRRDLRILDAGCGTGGMLDTLRKRGYTNLRGIDGSADAVAFCQERGLPVSLVNLNELADFEPETHYDTIICNDVFCYFTDADLAPLLQNLAERLKPGGLLLSNNNAFNAFAGQHDLAVGVIRRFTLSEFRQLLSPTPLRIQHAAYWSLLLSIPILLVRQWQRFQLRMGWRSAEQAESDVYLPPNWVNESLYRLARMEQSLLRRSPFGSSLFLELTR